jgi:hypothetical protein
MKTYKYYVLSIVLGGVLLVAGTPASQGYMGASPLPPELISSDVILFEDFESSNGLFDDDLSQGASSVTSVTSFSGNYALEMHNSDAGKFSSRVELGGAWDELYARYMFRVGQHTSACWNTSQHYKNMGFEAGTADCKGGDYQSDGTDCFTVRSRFTYPNLGVHVESAPFPGKFDDLNPVNVADGAWHCYEMRVKLNTPGAKNGEIRTWVDGQEKVRSNLEFRTVNSLKINKWWFTHWSNDNWCAPLYLDDLVISKARIGCPNLAPSSIPMAPSNLRVSQ